MDIQRLHLREHFSDSGKSRLIARRSHPTPSLGRVNLRMMTHTAPACSPTHTPNSQLPNRDTGHKTPHASPSSPAPAPAGVILGDPSNNGLCASDDADDAGDDGKWSYASPSAFTVSVVPVERSEDAKELVRSEIGRGRGGEGERGREGGRGRERARGREREEGRKKERRVLKR